MVKVPKISALLKKKCQGHIAISLNGIVIGVGKDSIFALKDAKKKMPDIEQKEFLVSRIHNDEVLAV